MFPASRSILIAFSCLLFSQTSLARNPAPIAPLTPVNSQFQQCRQHFAGQLPPQAAWQKPAVKSALCYDAFALLHDGDNKGPLYVAERLSRASLQQAAGRKRSDRFFADARLPRAQRAELADYKRSGWSRGHMAPAADMPSEQAMAQSFSLANMVPQSAINNQKAWASIENATRKYVMRASGDVYVITGPAYLQDRGSIGAGRVRIPSHLFKLVYDENTGRSWAHWIENTDEARPGTPISYAKLVERTGIDFLPVLRQRD